MKSFCESLREHGVGRKKMKLLTKKQQELHENRKISYICKEKLMINMLKIKSIVKLQIIIIQGKIEVLRIAYVLLRLAYLKKPLVFHNGSNYYYHFFIKDNLLVHEKIQKYTLPFQFQQKKKLQELIKNNDGTRLMASSSSNLVNNLTAGIDKIKCKREHNNKNCEWF